MENCRILKHHEILANFDLKKLILIKIQAILMELWTDLIILKESKKPSDKILRVWAKNQLSFEISEKILKFTCKNLIGKLIFYPLFLPFSRTFSFYTPLEHTKILGVAWGVLSAGLGGVLSNLGGWGGRGGCINPWICIFIPRSS